MNFKEAVALAEKNQNLIGKTLDGATIDEIIIYPTDAGSVERFKKDYARSLNAQQAILPYVDDDCGLAVVLNKEDIRKKNLFAYREFDELEDYFEIIK